ncbi:MAG TPA: GNAT family N-acetyltransferase [Mycobacterium sp.]|nr:GNAT family N-acetyltransferase [Mycobacterium sp.]
MFLADAAARRRPFDQPGVGSASWRTPWSRVQIASYLGRQDRSTHSTPYLGELDGVPLCYCELSRADLDPLAHYYAAREHEAGSHALMGPPNTAHGDWPLDLLRTVTTFQLDAPPGSHRRRRREQASNSAGRACTVPAHNGPRSAEQAGRLMVRDRGGAWSRTEPRGQRASTRYHTCRRLR